MNPGFEKFAPVEDMQFCSMGMLCQLAQVLPAQVRIAMQDAGIRFAMTMDGTGYLYVQDAEVIAKRCNAMRKELDDAAAKFEAATN